MYVPHDRFICFTDTPVNCEYVLLETDWPLWWGKMEIYKNMPGPTLILDLDTVILRKFEMTAEEQLHSYVMRHFTRDGFRAPEELACGVMFTTEEFRRKVYAHFSADPAKYIAEVRGDDQAYFKKYWNKDLRRFQDYFPDQFISFKLNYHQNGMTEDATFMVFHGLPRPWDVDLPWIPKCSPPAQSSHLAA